MSGMTPLSYLASQDAIEVMSVTDWLTDWLFALTWRMWLWWVMIPIDDFTDTFQYLLSFALFLWIDLLMNISNCKTNSIWKLQYSIFKENSLSSFLLHICMLLLWMCNFISLNPRRCLGFLVRLSAALEGDVAIRFASLFFHSFPSNLHIFYFYVTSKVCFPLYFSSRCSQNGWRRWRCTTFMGEKGQQGCQS